MAIRWKGIREHMRRAGLANARALSVAAGIGYPTAWRIVSGKAVHRVDVATLEKLAALFRVKNPLALLEYNPE